MVRRRRVAASLALVLSLGCRCDQEPQMSPRAYAPPLPEGGSVFFVGNSFLGWEGRDLPEWLRALGDRLEVPFEVGADIVPGDLPLAAFLAHPAVQEALASRKYAVWVLQAHEFEPVDHPAEFEQTIRDFDRAIRAAGGRTVLFMTWEFRWRRFLPELADAYERIGQALDLPIIPAGLIYRDCGRSPPGAEGPFFLTADPEHPEGDLHENMFGTLVNTYATFATLTGRNPLGQAFDAPGNHVPETQLRYFSDHAWARVAPRLLGLNADGGAP